MKVPCSRKQFSQECCRYYTLQAGEGWSPFRGPRYQRGSGLFSDLFRAAVPIIKQGAKHVGKRLLKTGVNLLSDISQGKSLKEAASERLKETGKELRSELGEKLKQTGQGKKRKCKTPIKRKRTKRDIFS